MRAVDESKTADSSMLMPAENSAGSHLMLAINQIIEAKVQVALRNALPHAVAAQMADIARRIPGMR